MWQNGTLLSDLIDGGGGALLTRVQSVFEPVRHAALTEGANDPETTTTTTNTPINADDARSNQEGERYSLDK